MSESSMHRRDFVRLSSATLVAAAATSFLPTGIGTLAGLNAVNPLLSVGFSEPAAGEVLPVVSASRLGGGDSRLARTGAKVTVHGLRRGSTARSGQGVHLNALFAVGESTVPYLAWSEAGSGSGRVKFQVPPSEQLTFSIDRRRLTNLKGVRPSEVHHYLGYTSAAAGEIPRAELDVNGKGMCILAVNGSGPSLRPGTYFLALRNHRSDREPNWASMTVDPQTLTLSHLGRPVKLDYLVVSVDLA
jgi:hypothetical protein